MTCRSSPALLARTGTWATRGPLPRRRRNRRRMAISRGPIAVSNRPPKRRHGEAAHGRERGGQQLCRFGHASAVTGGQAACQCARVGHDRLYHRRKWRRCLGFRGPKLRVRRTGSGGASACARGRTVPETTGSRTAQFYRPGQGTISRQNHPAATKAQAPGFSGVSWRRCNRCGIGTAAGSMAKTAAYLSGAVSCRAVRHFQRNTAPVPRRGCLLAGFNCVEKPSALTVEATP